MPSRIENYALIGDCETAALVSKGGSIDWLCWPRFDSAACFSELLGDANHGRWSIAPATVGSDINVSRRYAHNTLILETEFTSADGKNAAVLVDFMPLREGRNESHLVRFVVGKRGSMAMRTELIVRFGYGGWVPWVSRSDAGDLIAIAGPDKAHPSGASRRGVDDGRRFRRLSRPAGAACLDVCALTLAPTGAN